MILLLGAGGYVGQAPRVRQPGRLRALAGPGRAHQDEVERGYRRNPL